MRLKLAKIAAAVAVALGLLSLGGCSYVNPQAATADAGLELAKQLHELPIEGFSFSDITVPNLGFDYSNPDSSFIARPSSKNIGQSCEALVSWVKAHLTDLRAELQYSTVSAGQELTACKTAAYGLLKNSAPGLSITGLYKRTLVYVLYEGAVDGAVTIGVDGSGSAASERTVGNGSMAADVQRILNAIAVFRDENQIKFFSEKQIAEFWDGYKAKLGKKTTMAWKPASDGKVHQVEIDGVPGGLLLFCMSIDPVNTELVGPDVGPDYLFVLGEYGTGLKSFGFAASDACPKI